jgi:hypothetical protein
MTVLITLKKPFKMTVLITLQEESSNYPLR